MDKKIAEEEMFEGYMDGLDLDNPDPTKNRTRSYRHGFENARNDKNNIGCMAGDRREKAIRAIYLDTLKL